MNPGDLIDGKYRIDRVLGEGGMGLVVAATHVVLGNSVAIKVLKPDALAMPSVPARFLREARAAARLRGDHVGRVLDVGQLPGNEPYMVMEMLRGGDLAGASRSARIPIARAAEYIAQACEGLAEAHALGMIHRDIKPANLFLAEQPNGSAIVKVLDFGIATQPASDGEHSLTRTETVMGSPAYMSPEQLRSAKAVDARSDVWSLGVTLYELVSGAQPFRGDSFSALSIAIATEPHVPLRDVDAAMVAVIDRCLEKDPSKRFQDVAALALALAPLFPDGALAARQVSRALGPLAATEASLPAMATAPAHAQTTGLRGESITTTPAKSRLPVVLVAGMIAVAIPTAIFATRGSNDASKVDAAPIAVIDASSNAVADAPVAVAIPDTAAPSLEHALALRDTPEVALQETDLLIKTTPSSGPLRSYRAELMLAINKPEQAVDELALVVDPTLVSYAARSKIGDYLRANPKHRHAKAVAALVGIALSRPVAAGSARGSAAPPPPPEPAAVTVAPPTPPPAAGSGSAEPPKRKRCKANEWDCGL